MYVKYRKMSELNKNTALNYNQEVTVVINDREKKGTIVGYIVKLKEVYWDHHNIPWLDNGSTNYTHAIIGEKPSSSAIISAKLKTD